MEYDVANLKSAKQGKEKIEWAKGRMPVLGIIKKRFSKAKPLKGVRLGACLHVTSETANLMITLAKGGASVYLCASNPLSTQDDVASSLVAHYKIPVFAINGENNKTYYSHLQQVISFMPQITMDDGADLVAELLKLDIGEDYSVTNDKGKIWEFIGSSEETTTGVIRLKAMEKDNALKVPVVAVNDSDTKHLFDNRYGTGQSTIDGILRATNILLAGKTFVVSGYGWCGRGLAMRARGMGARVVVTEVDPVRALEAVMEGYQVMAMKKAAKSGDIFISVTGDKHVITYEHIKNMKDGAVIANSGHFNVEIELDTLEKKALSKRTIRKHVTQYKLRNKTINVLGEGRLVNLVAAEGHPSEVMDLSFANQALASEWLVQKRGSLKRKVYHLPENIDKEVARLKLKAMGIGIDRLTREQKKYLSSWEEGT